MKRGCELLLGLAVSLSAFAAEPDFAKETIPAEVVPEGAGADPAKAKAVEKKVLAIKEKVAKLWPSIVFEKNGKPIKYIVTFKTTEGPITIQMMPEVAPIHSRSFIALAKSGFYDGLTFHRCLPGFVIQGGCPVGEGYGGPGYHLRPEFSKVPHTKGILSMARTMRPDTAGSQFFLCVAEVPHLDGQYTVFGKVVKGLDVVDAIVAKPGNPRTGKPVAPVKIESATVTATEG